MWYLARPSWRLTVPGIPHPGTPAQATATFLIGLVLLGLGWLGLVYRAGRPGNPRRRLLMVVAVTAIWAVPVSLGPPLLSNDVYAYVAHGEMISRGIDPSAHGVAAIGRNDWTAGVDPVWRNDAAPYGPVAVATSESVVAVSGHDAARSVWIYRGVVLLALIAAGVGVALIATGAGVSPAVALAIGLANPVVLLHLVGGIHNDALMLALLSLGLAAAQRRRRYLAVVLLGLATAVKLPAAIGLVYLGWTWPGLIAPFRRRVLTTAAVLASVAAGIAVLCLLVGIGPGWLTALKSTGKISDTYSPSTKLGYSLGEILHGIGIHADGATLAAGVRLLGLAATAVLGLVVMLRSPRLGVVKATGIMLVAYVLLGPVIWPWYLPAGFALLAALGLGRAKPSYLVVCIAVSWFVWPTSVVSIGGFGGSYQNVRGLGVVLFVAGLAWAAQRFSTRWERRRDRVLEAGEALPPHLSEPGDVDAGEVATIR